MTTAARLCLCAALSGCTTGEGATTGPTSSPGESSSTSTANPTDATQGGEPTTMTSAPSGDTEPGTATGAAMTSTGAASTGAASTGATSTGGSSGTSSSGGTSGGSSGDGGIVALAVEPKQVTVSVKSGWSFPVEFKVSGVDGGGEAVAVAASWTIDDTGLGEITAFGGTFQARNTAAGGATITASAAGLQASAQVTVELVADAPTCPPRPPLTLGEPAAGTFRKQVAPEYEGTGVYHAIYLPPDWQPGRRYPVIVESPCNKYGSFTGKVDDATLGYHLAGCRSYIWIVVPYIQAQANLDYGWGEVPTTLAYWRTNVARALADYGGDPGAVIVTGFSRGAIGASFVGLSDDEVADLWLAFFMHSHADVLSNLTPDKGAGSATRMQRVRGRASFLSWGAAGDGGAVNSLKGVDLLTSFGYPVATLAVPDVGHTDVWMEADAASRQTVQAWLFAAVAARTGTHAIAGRVVDGGGQGVADATITSGARAVRTDAHGYYALRGLVPGLRGVSCAHPQWTCSPGQEVDISAGDAQDVDFTASP